MKTLILWFSVMMLVTTTFAEDRTLKADFRHRPPEMVVDGENLSGPLKDIIDEAAKIVGYQIKWKNVPWPRSVVNFKQGNVDILPRILRNKEREAFTYYLGPIGYQQKDILFLVRKGQENLLNSYEDLCKVQVGVKRGAAYFDKFNHDQKINKYLSYDDKNMSKMFAANRLDTMIILDKAAIETAFEKIGFTNYSYANYKYVQRIGNYYGLSKKSPHAQVYQKLNEVLLEMTKSGRVAEIYKKHNVVPPVQ